MYNSLVVENRDGLFLLSDRDEVIFVNPEASQILQINTERLDSASLEAIPVALEENDQEESLLHIVHTRTHLASGYLLRESGRLPISVSIDRVHTDSSYAYDSFCVVVLRDMSPIQEIQESARGLLG